MDAMLTPEEQVRLGKAMAEAVGSYRNDPRFRSMIDFAVCEARHQYGPADDERPERHAHEMATLAAAMVLSRIYTEDVELRTLKWERDHYKRLAEDGLMMSPLRSFIVPNPAAVG